jgi:hypothetical protein
VVDKLRFGATAGQVQIVQKIHGIILGPLPGSPTVSAAKTMKFEDASPNSFRNVPSTPERSAPTTEATLETARAMRTGALYLNGASEPDPLREIAQALTFTGQCAKIAPRQEKFDREFPFQIEAYAFSSTDSRSLEDRQNRLALLVPLNGWLRVDIAVTGVDLCAGEILIAPNLKMVLRAGLVKRTFRCW